MKEFRGKVAVVTGAASGIGLALSEKFASVGMKVVLADAEEKPRRNQPGSEEGLRIQRLRGF